MLFTIQTDRWAGVLNLAQGGGNAFRCVARQKKRERHHAGTTMALRTMNERAAWR